MASSDSTAGRHLQDTGATESDGRLTVTRLNTAKSVSLMVSGEVDSLSAGSLEKCIRRDELWGATDIRIDLQHTSFMDACGIRTLVEAARRAGAGGWHLRVVNPRGIVRKVCEITQLNDMIDHWQRDEGRVFQLRASGVSG